MADLITAVIEALSESASQGLGDLVSQKMNAGNDSQDISSIQCHSTQCHYPQGNASGYNHWDGDFFDGVPNPDSSLLFNNPLDHGFIDDKTPVDHDDNTGNLKGQGIEPRQPEKSPTKEQTPVDRAESSEDINSPESDYVSDQEINQNDRANIEQGNSMEQKLPEDEPQPTDRAKADHRDDFSMDPEPSPDDRADSSEPNQAKKEKKASIESRIEVREVTNSQDPPLPPLKRFGFQKFTKITMPIGGPFSVESGFTLGTNENLRELGVAIIWLMNKSSVSDNLVKDSVTINGRFGTTLRYPNQQRGGQVSLDSRLLAKFKKEAPNILGKAGSGMNFDFSNSILSQNNENLFPLHNRLRARLTISPWLEQQFQSFNIYSKEVTPFARMTGSLRGELLTNSDFNPRNIEFNIRKTLEGNFGARIIDPKGKRSNPVEISVRYRQHHLTRMQYMQEDQYSRERSLLLIIEVPF